MSVLAVDGLVKHFRVGGRGRRSTARVHAVDGVSIQLEAGRTLAVVGESGSGKSTLARCILRLEDADSGHIDLEGRDLLALRGRSLRRARRDIQMVFQDPLDSLNPRFTFRRTLLVALRLAGVPRPDRAARVDSLIAAVGMKRDDLDKYPHEFSGGQQQRIAIARALAFEPRVLVLDEPTASLDVSVQGQIMGLLADLRERLGLAYLLISHDLANVRHVADELAVMYLGRIVERGPCATVLLRPQHPYTVALLESVLTADPDRRLPPPDLHGEVPSAISLPAGCRFAPRCSRRIEPCTVAEPSLLPTAPGSWAACVHVTTTAAAEPGDHNEGATS